jgi:hypothetical protein
MYQKVALSATTSSEYAITPSTTVAIAIAILTISEVFMAGSSRFRARRGSRIRKKRTLGRIAAARE